jgi:hypothetical protein
VEIVKSLRDTAEAVPERTRAARKMPTSRRRKDKDGIVATTMASAMTRTPPARAPTQTRRGAIPVSPLSRQRSQNQRHGQGDKTPRASQTQNRTPGNQNSSPSRPRPRPIFNGVIRDPLVLSPSRSQPRREIEADDEDDEDDDMDLDREPPTPTPKSGMSRRFSTDARGPAAAPTSISAQGQGQGPARRARLSKENVARATKGMDTDMDVDGDDDRQMGSDESGSLDQEGSAMEVGGQEPDEETSQEDTQTLQDDNSTSLFTPPPMSPLPPVQASPHRTFGSPPEPQYEDQASPGTPLQPTSPLDRDPFSSPILPAPSIRSVFTFSRSPTPEPSSSPLVPFARQSVSPDVLAEKQEQRLRRLGRWKERMRAMEGVLDDSASSEAGGVSDHGSEEGTEEEEEHRTPYSHARDRDRDRVSARGEAQVQKPPTSSSSLRVSSLTGLPPTTSPRTPSASPATRKVKRTVSRPSTVPSKYMRKFEPFIRRDPEPEPVPSSVPSGSVSAPPTPAMREEGVKGPGGDEVGREAGGGGDSSSDSLLSPSNGVVAGGVDAENDTAPAPQSRLESSSRSPTHARNRLPNRRQWQELGTTSSGGWNAAGPSAVAKTKRSPSKGNGNDEDQNVEDMDNVPPETPQGSANRAHAWNDPAGIAPLASPILLPAVPKDQGHAPFESLPRPNQKRGHRQRQSDSSSPSIGSSPLISPDLKNIPPLTLAPGTNPASYKEGMITNMFFTNFVALQRVGARGRTAQERQGAEVLRALEALGPVASGRRGGGNTSGNGDRDDFIRGDGQGSGVQVSAGVDEEHPTGGWNDVTSSRSDAMTRRASSSSSKRLPSSTSVPMHVVTPLQEMVTVASVQERFASVSIKDEDEGQDWGLVTGSTQTDAGAGREASVETSSEWDMLVYPDEEEV